MNGVKNGSMNGPALNGRLEIGCQTYSLRTRAATDMLEAVRKAGFRTIELWRGHADFAGDFGAAARMRRATERIGIVIQSYSVGGFLRESPVRVEAALTRAFAFGAELGVTLLTGVVDRRAVQVVDELCRKTGIRFALENHWYADLARPDDYAEALATTTPLVGVTLDTGHLAAAGVEPHVAVEQFGTRLLNVHLKDVVVAGRLARLVWRRPRMEGRTIGAGQVGLEALLATLVRTRYAGCCAIEDERPELPLSELQAGLRACTGWMRAARLADAPSEERSCTSSS